MEKEPIPSSPEPICEGQTATERLLAKLCRHSFLSLWSYPSVYRDQGRAGGKGDGKEVCDLLVVFENHVLIFSDKDCEFIDTGNSELDWSRWYRKAVLKSADQVYGAERWIRRFPQNLFQDRECKHVLPINLPDPNSAVFHRIVVAHDRARMYQEMLGGSGSLILDSTLAGAAHLDRPFTIGQVDPAKGYVHVFDDITLHIVMETLDTITDFTQYLTKKERFLTGSQGVLAAGEEELLALYLGHLNPSGEHDFFVKGDFDVIHLDEGFWDRFANSPERLAQIEQNGISYLWDELIEKFAFHAITGTQYYSTGEPLRDQEKAFRWMAREPRTRRRTLASGFLELLKRNERSDRLWDARVLVPVDRSEPYYVFLCLRQPTNASNEEYRKKRFVLLHDYSHVVKLRWPDAVHIVGIATEPGDVKHRSEDLTYLNVTNWNAKNQLEAKQIQERLGILKKIKMTRDVEYEYPVDHTGAPRKAKPRSRNSKCHCGSGKRYRNCHGRKLFLKKMKQKETPPRT